jgi:ADP-ribose pyrophosphatase
LNSPGFCDEETLVYLASDLRPGRPARHGPEERFIEVVEVPLSDVPACITRGDVVDAQTVVGLLLARDAAEKRPVTPSGK